MPAVLDEKQLGFSGEYLGEALGYPAVPLKDLAHLLQLAAMSLVLEETAQLQEADLTGGNELTKAFKNTVKTN